LEKGSRNTMVSTRNGIYVSGGVGNNIGLNTSSTILSFTPINFTSNQMFGMVSNTYFISNNGLYISGDNTVIP
jgi:hypothetical protein